jgi:hypothetical protein
VQKASFSASQSNSIAKQLTHMKKKLAPLSISFSFARDNKKLALPRFFSTVPNHLCSFM